ncbi:hypothetical protein NXF25_019188 [Crotalus adamanteus]|uniref:Uncharacterized protein n=1 Tax=Crotalus adamanteus TaxID=8729 RepID=A0AAW1B1N9_CROAD
MEGGQTVHPRQLAVTSLAM